jgi:hypothetical protein
MTPRNPTGDRGPRQPLCEKPGKRKTRIEELRSAVALDGALHSGQRLLQILRIHNGCHLDLGV